MSQRKDAKTQSRKDENTLALSVLTREELEWLFKAVVVRAGSLSSEARELELMGALGALTAEIEDREFKRR